MLRTHNIFISHSWNYSQAYLNLTNLLEYEKGFKFRNYSVPRNNPIHQACSTIKLREAIKEKMRPCGVVLILAGVYSTYSKWINIEIEIAQSAFHCRKPIIAIKPHGNINISSIVRNSSDLVVNWNANSIVKAIRKVTQ